MTSAFGIPAIPASTQSSLFGGSSFASAPTNNSIFGGFGSATTEPTPSGGFFGNLVKPDQNVMNKFETSSAETPATVTSPFSSQGGSFGNSAGLFASFGSPTPQTAPASNVFGGSSFGNAGNSAFGGNTQDPNSGGSLFGNSTFGQAAPANNSIFGGGNSNVSGSNAFGSNVFGNQPVAPATSAFGSSFGQLPASTG